MSTFTKRIPFSVSLLVIAGGCGFRVAGSGPDADTPGEDAGIDALVDANEQQDAAIDAMTFCYGSFLSVCLDAPPQAAVTITADTAIDTDTSSMCQPTTMGTAAGTCVVAGTEITIGLAATLRATGSKPLVLLATTGAITITGTVDVASRRAGGVTIGAGFPTGTCNAGTDPTGEGGGQGGSYGSDGGDGGQGDSGTKGTKGARVTLGSTLRAGCAGANGAGTSRGEGGAGGGAVALIASSIQIAATGTINASGMGGQGGQANSDGAGGGGSGGTIVLDSPDLALTVGGRVFANGGGGGEGGTAGGNDGDDGDDPIAPTVAAAGGTGSSSGGDGGDGSVGSGNAENANDGNSGGAGGGGGGGAGVIRSTDPMPPSSSNISPPFS